MSSVKNVQVRKLYWDESKLCARKWNPSPRKRVEALAEADTDRSDRPIAEGPQKTISIEIYSWRAGFRGSSAEAESTYHSPAEAETVVAEAARKTVRKPRVLATAHIASTLMSHRFSHWIGCVGKIPPKKMSFSPKRWVSSIFFPFSCPLTHLKPGNFPWISHENQSIAGRAPSHPAPAVAVACRFGLRPGHLPHCAETWEHQSVRRPW